MVSERRSWSKNPVQGVVLWFKRQPMKRKTLVGVLAGIVMLIVLRYMVRDHDNLFVASEVIHAAGVLVLIYKLTKEKNCAGLSLKSQELTAIFLGVRLLCSFMMEYNTHTILDSATLLVTLWVIYTIRFKLKSSMALMREKDNLSIYFVLVPCALLAAFVHPRTGHRVVYRVLWAFCVYLESVSVLPQLRVMQNWKLVEPFTAHYVFALGVARFFSCAHWVLQFIDRRAFFLSTLGWSSRGFWAPTVFLSEVVQTFILADFCYYYVKSVVDGQLMVRLPAGVV